MSWGEFLALLIPQLITQIGLIGKIIWELVRNNRNNIKKKVVIDMIENGVISIEPPKAKQWVKQLLSGETSAEEAITEMKLNTEKE